METSGVSLFVARDVRKPLWTVRLTWLGVNEVGLKSEPLSAIFRTLVSAPHIVARKLQKQWLRGKTIWNANTDFRYLS